MRRRLPLSFALVAVLAYPSAAQAAWFGGEALADGVSAVGGVDIGRDGDGAVVYLKQDAGAAHVFVSRKIDGIWRAPERVDAGLNAPASEAAIAAGEGHKLAVAFISGGSAYATVAVEGLEPQPFQPPALLQAADMASPASGIDADLGPNGYAYATWAGPGGGGGDVRAARLEGAGWVTVPEALDIDPARSAGRAGSRPRVGVGADGNAMVVWGEEHADGRTHIYERRVLGTRLSVVPQEASLPDLGGAGGGSATAPDVDIEDDSSFAMVTWSQPFGGTARGMMRRLVGSAFEAPTVLDDGAVAGVPDAAVDGRGQGYAVAATAGGQVLGRVLDDEAVAAPERVDTLGGAVEPVTAVGELGERAVAWRSGAEVRGRFGLSEEPLQPEAVLSRGDLPAPGPPAIAADLVGDALVAFLQGDRLVVADHDREPGKPAGGTTREWKPRPRPEFRWRPGAELWGPLTFTVQLDGVTLLTTTATRVRPPSRIADGDYRWTVLATDQRGQTTSSDPRPLRVDTRKPKLKLRIRGPRVPGALLRFKIRARDKTSGIAKTEIDFGDGSADATTTRARHRFSAGLHRLRVKAVDEAGNVARKRARLRIG